MFSVEDSIAGEDVVVVCGAAQLPLPLNAGRWAVGRMVRQHLRDSEGSRVLRTVHASSSEQTWWVGDGGVALGAAVDAWAEGRGDARDVGAVAIPLDARVYLARLEDGLVVEEWVLAGESARERAARLRESEGRVVALDVGGRADAVEDLVVAGSAGDVELERFRLEPSLLAFARRGLFHRAYPIALALLVGLPGGVWLWWEQGRVAAAAGAAQSIMAAAAAGEMMGEFGGAGKLADFAAMVGEDAMVALHREGLDRVEMVLAQQTVSMQGGAVGFVAGARDYARARGGEFVMRGGTWQVLRAVGVVPDERSVESFGIEAVTARLYGMEAVGAKVSLVDRRVGARTVTARFMVSVAAPSPFELGELARRLQGEPVALDRVECKYVRWVMDSCDVELTAKGVPGL